MAWSFRSLSLQAINADILEFGAGIQVDFFFNLLCLNPSSFESIFVWFSVEGTGLTLFISWKNAALWICV